MSLPALAQSGAVPVAAATSEPVDLGTALRAAVERNPLVAARRAELAAAGHRIEQAEAERLPSLSTEVRSRQDSTGRGVLRLQQPVWAFGKIDSRIALARAEQEVARLEDLQARRLLIEQTAAAYATVLGLRARLAHGQRNVSEHAELQEMIDRRRLGGVASSSDVRLATARLLLAQSQQAQLDGQLEGARQELAALTLSPIGAVDEALPDFTAQLVQLSDASEALEREATVLRSQAQLDVARTETTLKQAELTPTLSLSAEHDLFPTSGNTDRFRMGLVFSAALDGMGRKGTGDLKAQAQRVAAAQAQVQAARTDVRRRVANLLNQWRMQAVLIDLQERSLTTIAETLQSVLRQFDAGRKGWLDVLNVQRELADGRQQLETARTARADAALRLAALLGWLDESAGMSVPAVAATP
jgi:adhesin transport system outer membrane protein